MEAHADFDGMLRTIVFDCRVRHRLPVTQDWDTTSEQDWPATCLNTVPG